MLEKKLLAGLVLAILALVMGCKSNRDTFSGISSVPGYEELSSDSENVEVITSVERSSSSQGKEDTSMQDGFTPISKENFLAQVSDAEKNVYSLDKDNLYDYYHLTVYDADGMRCNQYLAMGKRVWSKLKRLGVSIKQNKLGYGFTVFANSDEPNNLVSQTALVTNRAVYFYCDTTDNKNTSMRHRVLVVYESRNGKEHSGDIVPDMKVPLVAPRLEALRGDMETGVLRIRDIVFLDANAYYDELKKGVQAMSR